jgi:hypothetical protein
LSPTGKNQDFSEIIHQHVKLESDTQIDENTRNKIRLTPWLVVWSQPACRRFCRHSVFASLSAT